MVLQLSIQPRNADELAALRVRRKAGAPEPTYGGQLQNFSIQNIRAEGEMTISYQEVRVLLADDEMVFLRQPTYGIAGLHYGPLHPDTTLSARIAPPIIGMGLLEAIPESDILEHADPHDSNGDGISGRPNQVWSDQLEHVVLGRFGWKAGQPTIAQQAANAFQKDMGISTPIYANPYGDCTETQNECLSAAHGGPSADNTVEAGAKLFELLEFYARNLGVPARRDVGDTQVLKGKQLFYESNCVGCHVPKFVTRRDSIGEEQSFQLIWPYTDLLLHDMGEGLADSRPEGEATGREWRTPPLWGIGLTQMVSGHTRFLHDGRARNLLEAVIWHGGEAEAARQHVIQMTKEERAALLTFLGSL